MHVVVTRPAHDAEPLKSRLEELGCRVSLAPLMEIVSNEISAEALTGATALVATSRNALAALAKSPALLSAIDLPIYVVGPATAELAREMGFKRVIEGDGRVEHLVPILAAEGDGQQLIYLRGEILAFDLERALAACGVKILPVLAYRSVAAKTLPTDVIKALQSGSIDAVTLMSPRTARIWAGLVAPLPPVQLSRVTYLCLSERVVEALGSLAKPDKVLASSQPNIEEMLALIKRLAANSKAE